MRIKKYENWKLATTNRPNTTCIRTQKISEIFSVSQLLQTPKKITSHQGEHQYNLTDPKAINHTFNLNRKNFSKTDIQISIFVQPLNRALREEAIKHKIKQRIKEQFSLQNSTDSISFFCKQANPNKLSSTNIQQIKTQPKENRVYVKGNSVALSSVDEKKRSKSSFLRTSLPNFIQKNKIIKINEFIISQKQARQKFKLGPVEIKKRLSSSLAARQKKAVSYLQKENSLKEIEPWQIDEGSHIFEL